MTARMQAAVHLVIATERWRKRKRKEDIKNAGSVFVSSVIFVFVISPNILKPAVQALIVQLSTSFHHMLEVACQIINKICTAQKVVKSWTNKRIFSDVCSSCTICINFPVTKIIAYYCLSIFNLEIFTFMYINFIFLFLFSLFHFIYCSFFCWFSDCHNCLYK